MGAYYEMIGEKNKGEKNGAHMNVTWDATGYERDFSFVPSYGEDVVDLIDVRPGETCLDLGCGNGALTVALRERGLDAFGMDASPEMLALARERHPELRLLEGDATSFTLERPVDVVFSNAVLHWIDRERHSEALAHVAAALRPEGQFVFECGGHGCGARIHAALAREFEARGLAYELPFYFPTIGEYAPLVEAAGMRVTHALLFDRPTALKGPNGMADWIRMFVQRPFEGMAPELADEIVAAAVASLAGELLRDGTWYADYVRLRMRAVKVQ